MQISFRCDKCGQTLAITGAAAGTTIDCPNCGKPAYVPSGAATGSADPPLRIEVATAPSGPGPTATSQLPANDPPPADKAKAHPAIVASVCCLLVCVLAVLAGLLLEQQIPGAGLLAILAGVPFMGGAMLCALYGMCHGWLKSGLLLLGGVALMLVLSCGSALVTAVHSVSTGSAALPPQSQELQQQLEKLLQQLTQ